MSVHLPRPDQLIEHPELAALSTLLVHLDLARRALMAANPAIWRGQRRPDTPLECRAGGIQLRADLLAHDVEDYVRLLLANHSHESAGPGT